MIKSSEKISLLPGRLLGLRIVQQEIDSTQDKDLLRKIRCSTKIGSKGLMQEDTRTAQDKELLRKIRYSAKIGGKGGLKNTI